MNAFANQMLIVAFALCFVGCNKPTELSVGSTPPPAVEDIERAWSKWMAAELGAEAEHPIKDEQGRGRVDIVTDTHAIEVEWPKRSKREESLDQASRYAKATGKTPAVVFLLGRGKADYEQTVVDEVRAAGFERLPQVRVFTFDVRKPDVDKLRAQLEPSEQKK